MQLDTKKCPRCDKSKSLSEYDKNKTKKDGHQSTCKSCRALIRAQSACINQKTTHEYYLTHKNDRLLYQRQYRKTKRLIDNKYRITANLRTRLSRAIGGTRKEKIELEAIIGCTISRLMDHLASKFKPGMSWSNYGEWHIDHIKPCASFNLEAITEQQKCFNYLNLQPLWALENKIKGARADIAGKRGNNDHARKNRAPAQIGAP